MTKLILKFFLMILLIIPYQSTPASSKKQSLDIDYIRSLPKADQRKIIDHIIKVIVKLEDIQNKKLGDKRTVFLKRNIYRLLNIIISEAHADEPFVNIDVNSNRCLYGGWLSYMYKGYCMKPTTIEVFKKNNSSDPVILKIFEDSKNLREEYKLAHSEAGNKCPNDSTQITCNPLLFGKVKGCVDAGVKKSVNTSLLCWKATKDQGIDITDILANSLNCKHSTNFNQLIQYVFDLCACAPPEKSVKRSDSYKYYKTAMFSHRTCMALNAQIAELIDDKNIRDNLNEKIQCIKENGVDLIRYREWSDTVRDYLKNVNDQGLMSGKLTMEKYEEWEELTKEEKTKKEQEKKKAYLTDNFKCDFSAKDPVDPAPPVKPVVDPDDPAVKPDDPAVKPDDPVEDPTQPEAPVKCSEEQLAQGMIQDDESNTCECEAGKSLQDTEEKDDQGNPIKKCLETNGSSTDEPDEPQTPGSCSEEQLAQGMIPDDEAKTCDCEAGKSVQETDEKDDEGNPIKKCLDTTSGDDDDSKVKDCTTDPDAPTGSEWDAGSKTCSCPSNQVIKNKVCVPKTNTPLNGMPYQMQPQMQQPAQIINNTYGGDGV